MFTQIARQQIWSLSNDIQDVNDECWKTTGMHLKFVCLVKLLSNIEGWGLILGAHKKVWTDSDGIFVF